MADIIDSTGLTLSSYEELLSDLQEGMNEIYAQDGDSINFDSSTPDGQMTNIMTQIGSDMRELAREVYNSFDPDKCTGVLQDSRYALNFIERKGGTFTIQNIDVTANKTVELQGLDSNYNDLEASSYTVSDNAGNNWYLIDSTTILAGTTSLPFRSQNLGLVQPTIGTITNQVTKVLGITGVNNSIAPTTLGEEQETDAEFRIRRERSVAINGQNNTDSMTGQLLALTGITDVKVWVNSEDTTDSTGTAPYTVWVIVEGGANSDIADVIYQNACGLPTRGNVSVDTISVSGQQVTINFDRANPVPLYIRFDFQPTVDISAIDFASIKASLAGDLTYTLGQEAETSRITTFAQNAILVNGDCGYALNVEISTDGSTWEDYIESESYQDKFVVDPSRITITTIGV